MRWLLRGYEPLVSFFVRRRSVAVGLGGALIAVGFAVFPFLGSEFTPRLQEGTIVVRLTMAPSIALRESVRVTQTVERRLMKVPEITGVVTRIGRGEVGAHADPINSAEMYVLLAPKEKWRSACGPASTPASVGSSRQKMVAPSVQRPSPRRRRVFARALRSGGS